MRSRDKIRVRRRWLVDKELTVETFAEPLKKFGVHFSTAQKWFCTGRDPRDGAKVAIRESWGEKCPLLS